MAFRYTARAVAGVLLAAGWPAGAQVILPRCSTLLAGGTCQFQVRMPPAGVPEPAGPHAQDWDWQLLDGGVGTLDPLTGSYQAPQVAEPCEVKLRASYRPDPGIAAEAWLLILPHEPCHLLAQVLGPGWLEPYSLDLPFLDPATGRRGSTGTATVELLAGPREPLPAQWAGCGLPFTLRWQPQPEAQAQLLSWGSGDGLTRKDVTGLASQLATARSRTRQFTVEALRRKPDGTWQSQCQTGALHVRGVLPLAGNALQDPGHGDGRGLAARFRSPCGLATAIEARPGQGSRTRHLVSDPQDHVIRLVSPAGDVSTPWGRPGEAGHLDFSPPSLLGKLVLGQSRRQSLAEPWGESRFHRPTFLCVSPFTRQLDGCRSWVCHVADSGNHVIRELRPDGTVATLAGAPGQAGHRDCAWPWDLCWRGPLFNDPQGLAQEGGWLFVADRGNRVIRSGYLADGRWTTLAGIPGVAGSLDGPAAAASFTGLRGLAMAGRWPDRALYAVDGHAIRRISAWGPNQVEVTTVLGVVDSPGFQDVNGDSRDERRGSLRQPCLRDPCGLYGTPDALYIADQGNHAVRCFWIDALALTTLAGAPGLGETRPGLLRDGMAVPLLDERYAGLASPRGLAAGAEPATLLVAGGRSVVEIDAAWGQRTHLLPVALECPPVRAGEAFAVRFSVAAISPAGQPGLRPIHYSVDFIEADGSLADRVRGTGASGSPMSVQGCLFQPGPGTVAVRCVSDEGVSVGAQRQLQVAGR